MAHHIYTTDAFVLDSIPTGEADAFFVLFTRDLGLIRAIAKGVRLQKSKLRYSLQEFSQTKVSLVRGKEVWRITSARIEDSLYSRYRNDKQVLHVIAQIDVLLKRLVGGEEKNEALFEIVIEAIEFLESHEQWGEELKLFEITVVLKILHNLGYMRRVPELERSIEEPLSLELLKSLEPHKALALREINTSLHETQL
jgi:DNA repair protein RecO